LFIRVIQEDVVIIVLSDPNAGDEFDLTLCKAIAAQQRNECSNRKNDKPFFHRKAPLIKLLTKRAHRKTQIRGKEIFPSRGAAIPGERFNEACNVIQGNGNLPRTLIPDYSQSPMLPSTNFIG
jgi:hypothetical protein